MRSIARTTIGIAALALGGASSIASMSSCSTPKAVTEAPTEAAPTTAVEVTSWGSLREMIHEGRVEARVALATPLATPHLHAIGALAGMRGEITIRDGAAWIAVGDRDDGRAVRAAGPGADGASAALLVGAYVAQWQRVPIEEDIPFEQLDARIEALATAAGVDVEQPFPFLVEGTLGEVRWHVLKGPPEAGGPPHDHARNAVTGEAAALRATLVGFFSKHHQGVFTHRGQRVHAHVLDEASQLAAHADQVSVRAGSMLSLPPPSRATPQRPR